ERPELDESRELEEHDERRSAAAHRPGGAQEGDPGHGEGERRSGELGREQVEGGGGEPWGGAGEEGGSRERQERGERQGQAAADAPADRRHPETPRFEPPAGEERQGESEEKEELLGK